MLRDHSLGGDPGSRISQVLDEVSLPAQREFLRRYPHQLSGGQQQRLVIAMALICKPRVVVMDEPTTGLDVTTQAHVLATIQTLAREHQVACVYVTHDLSVVANLAARIGVMYAGRIIEQGPVEAVFAHAAHPYTRALVDSVPEVTEERRVRGIPGQGLGPGRRPLGCAFAPRCEYVGERCELEVPTRVEVAVAHEARCFKAQVVLNEHDRADDLAEAVAYPRLAPSEGLSVQGVSAWHGASRVLDDVILDAPASSCLAIVGESGSGKTTLARCASGLHSHFRGRIVFDGQTLVPGTARRSDELRRIVQYVFQNPYASLNPRRAVGETLAQPARLFYGRGSDTRARIERALAEVGLDGELAGAYPAELSGGQRQRVAIARALVAEPRLLICDEVTSSLDVSVQALVIDLLARLQQETGLTLIFVTHNLALVRSIAQRVVVMSEGRVVEAGLTDEILASPGEAYTRRLLADTPTLAATGA